MKEMLVLSPYNGRKRKKTTLPYSSTIEKEKGKHHKRVV
jgi:hypothetical protein